MWAVARMDKQAPPFLLPEPLAHPALTMTYLGSRDAHTRTRANAHVRICACSRDGNIGGQDTVVYNAGYVIHII